MTVKTFNDKKLKEALKTCDTYILDYIKSLKNESEGWKYVAQCGNKKIRELCEKIKLLTYGIEKLEIEWKNSGYNLGGGNRQ